MKYCKGCNHQVKFGEDHCPTCGMPQSNNLYLGVWVSLAYLVMLALLALFMATESRAVELKCEGWVTVKVMDGAIEVNGIPHQFIESMGSTLIYEGNVWLSGSMDAHGNLDLDNSELIYENKHRICRESWK